MMARFRRLAHGMRALVRGHRLERDLDAELRAFFDLAVEQKMRAGMSRAAATRAARRELGNLDVVKEQVREVGWEAGVEGGWRDLRYAARMLRRTPGFAAAVLAIFALGIGATTTIFSFVNAVLVRPLPFEDSARLVVVQPEGPSAAVMPADFLDWHLHNRGFLNLAAIASATVNLTDAGEPEQVRAAAVTAAFFEVMRATPLFGRTFRPGEDRPGSDDVAVIGAGLWRRRFMADPGVIGRRLTLDNRPVTLVGVMPDGFDFPRDLSPFAMGRSRPIDVWTPLILHPGDRSNAFLRVIGRLRSDWRLDQADADMDALAARLAPLAPPDRRVERVHVASLRDRIVADVRPLLLVLSGAVGLLLAIACSNVANLLVARGAARQKELTLRAALGASRWRIVRQLLMEALLLASLGGMAGLVLAFQGVAALRSAIPPGSLPRLEEIVVDRQALVFTLITSLATGLIFGLLPALRSSRTDAGATIKDHGATTTPRPTLLNWLIAAEVALTFVLLVGAGLLIHSFWRLTGVDPGFEPGRILTASVTLPETAYDTSAAMTRFSSEVLARLDGAPGVAEVAAVNWLPLGGSLIRGTFLVEGVREIPPAAAVVSKPAVSPGYFRALGIPLVSGRDFDARDGPSSPGVVIVSASLARALWPGADPLGKRLTSGFGPPEEQPWLTVVGVVGDVKQTGLGDETLPAVYMPLPQAPRPFLLRRLTFVVRTTGEPAAVAPLLRGAIRRVDANLPFDRVETMSALVGTSVSEPRFRSTVMGLFAAAALALVGAGVLGSVSYSVARRTREIGVRMALGAAPRGVLRLVIGQLLWVTAAGLAVGVLAAVGLTRLLARFLFAVGPTDPITFMAAAVVLVSAAAAAAYVPARRAARVDPLIALRLE
jgi:predicted permease